MRSKFRAFVLAIAALLIISGVAPTTEASAQSSFSGVVRPERIVGGSAATISDAPWQVALIDRSEESDYSNDLDAQYCGGSILDDKWIVTAAHCVVNMSAFDIGVLTGVTSLSSSAFTTSKISTVNQIFVHEDYDSSSTYDDIALIRLEDPLSLVPGVREAVSLPSNEVPTGTELLVTGWGATDNEMFEYPQVLQKSNQEALSPDACADFGDAFDAVTQLCVGVAPYDSIAACAGDSGGPAVDLSGIEPLLVGLTSYGNAAGCVEGVPSSFTKLTAYLDWIDAIMNSSGTGSISSVSIEKEHTKVFPKRDGFRDTVSIAAVVESTGGPGVVEPLAAGSTIAVYKGTTKIASWPITSTGRSIVSWSGRRSGHIKKGSYTIKVVANGVDGVRQTARSSISVSAKKLEWVTVYKKVSGERLFQYENRDPADFESQCRVEDGSLYMNSGSYVFSCGGRKVVPAAALTSYANATLRMIVQVDMTLNSTNSWFGVDGAAGTERRITQPQKYRWEMGELQPIFDEELQKYVVWPHITVDPFTWMFVHYVKFGFTYRVLA